MDAGGRAYVITTDGREISRSIYGTSWDDVHDKLTRLQADTMSGKRIATTSKTVGEYLTYWLSEHARHRVRATTFQSYEILVRLYLIPLFGNKKLTRLRPGDIRRGFFQLKQTCQCCARGKDQAREDRLPRLAALVRVAAVQPARAAGPDSGRPRPRFTGNHEATRDSAGRTSWTKINFTPLTKALSVR